MSRGPAVALLLLAAWLAASCTHLQRAGCISRAIADGLACIPAGVSRKAPPTEVERLLCQAAREDGTPGWERACEGVQ